MRRLQDIMAPVWAIPLAPIQESRQDLVPVQVQARLPAIYHEALDTKQLHYTRALRQTIPPALTQQSHQALVQVRVQVWQQQVHLEH